MKPVNVYGEIRFGEKEERSSVCSAVRHVQELFARFVRDARGADLKLIDVLVLSELQNGTQELRGGGAEDPSKIVTVFLLASAFAVVLFQEKVDDKGSPCIQSSQSKSRELDWQSNAGGVETEEVVVDGGPCVTTKMTIYLSEL